MTHALSYMVCFLQLFSSFIACVHFSFLSHICGSFSLPLSMQSRIGHFPLLPEPPKSPERPRIKGASEQGKRHPRPCYILHTDNPHIYNQLQPISKLSKTTLFSISFSPFPFLLSPFIFPFTFPTSFLPSPALGISAFCIRQAWRIGNAAFLSSPPCEAG